MPHFSPLSRAIFIALAYVGLVVTASVVVPAGPRRATELSVADNGTFTLSTWRKQYTTDCAIDLWAADFRHIRRIQAPDRVTGWAHSLSLDGQSLAVITTDQRTQHLDLLCVQADKRKRRMATLTQRLPMRLHLFGGERFVLLADGRDAELYDVESNLIDKYDAYEAMPISDHQRRFFLISSLVEVEPGQFGRLRRYYEATEQGLSLIDTRHYSDDGLTYLGTDIDSSGTIAVQEKDRITLISRDSQSRDVIFDASGGAVYRFSPSGKYLLLTRSPGLAILDTTTATVVASYMEDDYWSFRKSAFQDDERLLIIEESLEDSGRPSDRHNDRIVQWNWRDGQVQTQEVGWVTSRGADAMRGALVIASLLWFTIVVFQARRQRNWQWPLAGTGAATLLLGLCASWHPLAERMYADGEVETLPWIILVVVWLTAACSGSIWTIFGPGRFAHRLSAFCVACAMAAWQLHWLSAHGSWIAVLVVLLTAGWLLLLLMLLKQSASFVIAQGDINRDRAESPPERSISIGELLWLMTSLAIGLAIISRLNPLDMTYWDVAAFALYGMLFSTVAGVVVWASLSTAAWWKRYSAFAVVLGMATIVMLMIISTGFLGRADVSIVWALAAVLTLVMWLGALLIWSWLLVFRLCGYRVF